MVLAKKDVPARNVRAKESFDLVRVKKQMVEYDESHFLDPMKYNYFLLTNNINNLMKYKIFI